MKNFFLAVILVCCQAAVAQIQPPAYTIIELADLDGASATAVTINQLGHAAGRVDSPRTGIQQLAFWRHGRLIEESFDFDELTIEESPLIGGSAQVMNDHGVVVGYGLALNQPGFRSVIWSEHDGLTDMFPEFTGHSFARGINNAGQVVGSMAPDTRSPGEAFLWTQQKGLQIISPPGGLVGLSSGAIHINEDGLVLAFTVIDGFTSMWLHDTRTGQSRWLLDPAEGVSSAFKVNNHGHVAGTIRTREGDRQLALWMPDGQLTHSWFTSDNPDGGNAPMSINDHLWVVGLRHPSDPAEPAEAWLWIEGHTHVLKDLIAVPDLAAQWSHLHYVTQINNRGEIVGQGRRNGQLKAFLMTPMLDSTGIGRAYSAAWYDRNRSGEGWSLEILSAKKALGYWFTYDEFGNQRWLTGIGEIHGNRIDFPHLVDTSGGRFGPGFDPAKVVREFAGTATMTLSQCDRGRSEFHAYGQLVRTELQRLSRTLMLDCGDPAPVTHPRARQSGSWYDPDHSGEGFTLQWLAGGNALVTWFSYDAAGHQYWMQGVGDAVGSEIVFDNVYATRGARFGHAFDKAELQIFHWGELRMELLCMTGIAHYQSALAEFGAGTFNLKRLTILDGLECSN